MSKDTRTRVLQAAGPIFAEKGFEAATVREICQAADVNLASVNYHFGDKETLYLETIRRSHEMRLQQVPRPSYEADAEPREKLESFIRVMLSRVLGVNAEPWQAKLMMREVLQPSDACRDIVESYIRPQVEELQGILEPMLPAGVSRARKTQIAFSVIGQCLFYRFAGEVASMLTADQSRSHYEIGPLVNHITHFTLAAIDGMHAGRGDETGGRKKTVSQRRQAASRSTAHRNS